MNTKINQSEPTVIVNNAKEYESSVNNMRNILAYTFIYTLNTRKLYVKL